MLDVNDGSWGWAPAACIVAFVATLAGTRAFSGFALRRGILANPNFRTLHQRPMPRAGGVVFAGIFIAATTALWLTGSVDRVVMQALGCGGVVAMSFGLRDDIVAIGPLPQFVVQGILAGWALWCFGSRPLIDLPWVGTAVELAVSWAALVWLMNLYNFMDGIDGMAASGGVFFSATAILVLWLTRSDQSLIPVFGLLAACVLAFLLFNWPPASIFMGTAGSLFLGYSYCALIAATVPAHKISVWTWLTMFGYFAGDTTTTTVTRMFITRRWYGEHRSHAYQNLARVRGSHARVVRGVSLYHILWLLPLALWSALQPSIAPIAAAFALAPVVFWTLRYGPGLSSS